MFSEKGSRKLSNKAEQLTFRLVMKRESSFLNLLRGCGTRRAAQELRLHVVTPDVNV
jgi:hypothetical protein